MAQPTYHMHCRRAFSLLEVTVVLVLVSMLATLVAVSLTAPLRSARLADVVEGVTRFDELARSSARMSGRSVRLTVDASDGTLLMYKDDSGPIKMSTGSSFRVLQFATVGGSAEVSISPAGTSATYAVLVATGSRTLSGESRWILAPGLTGNLEVVDEETVRALLPQGVR